MSNTCETHHPAHGLRSRMSAGVDWFIPPHVRGGDLDVLRRARLVVTFAATLILLAIIYAAIFFSMNSPIGAAALGLGAGVGLASLYVMRRTGSSSAAGNLLTAAFFGVMTALACRLGGQGSIALPWYAGVPVVALSTAGRRSAVFWLAVTASSLAAFYTLDKSGYSYPNDLAPHHYELLGLLAWIGLIVLVLALALLYEAAKDQMLAQLKRAEVTLRREKGFSDSVLDSLPGVFYLIDGQGRFRRWNANFERVSGYSAEEFSKMHPLDFFRGQDKQTIAERIQKVLAAGKATAEAALVARNGSATPYFFTGKRATLGGEPHLVGMGIDITDRRQAAGALRESEERFRRFAVASSYGFAMGELTGHLIFANAATLRIVEEESEEAFTNKTFYQYYTPEDAERLRKEILPIVQEKGQWVGEVPLLSARGNPIATEQNIFLIRDEQGAPRMVGNIITDITDRKRAEETAAARTAELKQRTVELEKSRRVAMGMMEDAEQARETATRETTKLRSMIEGMDEGIVVADAADIITEVNEWFLDKVGLGRDDIVGKSLWEFHPDTEGTARVRAALDALRSGRRRDTFIVNRELLGMQLSLRMQPVLADGRYGGVILNAINVTDFVDARQAAEAATRSKSEFLANMSHEIRTPMTAIMGFANVIREETGCCTTCPVHATCEIRERNQENIETVCHNGEHLLQIINDILDISKIEAGKLEVERIRCSPVQVVADVKSLMQVRANAKNLPFRIEYIGAVPETIESDPTRLKQILVNLAGNAIKFTETGGVRLVTRLVEGPGFGAQGSGFRVQSVAPDLRVRRPRGNRAKTSHSEIRRHRTWIAATPFCNST